MSLFHSFRSCGERTGCVECLSDALPTDSALTEDGECQWCCGRCVGTTRECLDCLRDRGGRSAARDWISEADDCSELACSERDCKSCLDLHLHNDTCVWSRHFSRVNEHIRSVSR